MKNKKIIMMSLALAGTLFTTSCKKDKNDPIDSDSPSISIAGANPAFVDLHGTYTDAGASANDSKDGDISGNIAKGGSVDVNNAGMYTITYSVNDAAGNGGYATRTVYVRHTANTIAASYAVKDTCPNMSPTYYTDVLTASSATKVFTTKFANYNGGAVNFDISGNTGSEITVPSQTITAGIPAVPRAFYGSGSISADGKKMTITYTEVNPANSTSVTCTGIYTK